MIAKALDGAGYVERSGHGTEFIIEKCEAQGLATPQYKPASAIFHTIIWWKTETVHQVGGTMGGVEKPRSRLQKYRLTEKDRQMLATALRNGTKSPSTED